MVDGETDRVELVGWEIDGLGMHLPLFRPAGWRVLPGHEGRFIPHGRAGLLALGHDLAKLEEARDAAFQETRSGDLERRRKAEDKLADIGAIVLGLLRIVLQGVAIYKEHKARD